MEILDTSGFTAVRASDGGEAVELFEKSQPYEFDIILLEVQMPVRNGYEATKLIRRLNRPDAKTVIIYACTANTFREDQVKTRKIGMDGFIAKPIDVNKLMQKLGLGKSWRIDETLETDCRGGNTLCYAYGDTYRVQNTGGRKEADHTENKASATDGGQWRHGEGPGRQGFPALFHV